MRTPDLASAARERFAQRVGPAESLAGDADLLVRAARAMADRFQRGGTLIAFGNGAAGTDAHHVAVEFMHPVIIGKRALPAVSLTADVASLTALAGRPGLPDVFAHQIRTLARPADIALGISADGGCVNVLRGLREGARLGLLTVALFGGAGAGGAGVGSAGTGNAGAAGAGAGVGGALGSSPGIDHVLLARSDDPRVVKEVHVTAYHLLWELVHVFLELRGLPVPQAGPTGPGVLVAGRRP